MFAIYTHNRFNQVLIFSTYEEAYNWCLQSTRWNKAEINQNIKRVQKSSGNSWYNIFDY